MDYKNISEWEIKSTALGVPELAKLYNVSERTIRIWLQPFTKEIGRRIGHKYTPKQVRIIFSVLDPP